MSGQELHYQEGTVSDSLCRNIEAGSEIHRMPVVGHADKVLQDDLAAPVEIEFIDLNSYEMPSNRTGFNKTE